MFSKKKLSKKKKSEEKLSTKQLVWKQVKSHRMAAEDFVTVEIKRSSKLGSWVVLYREGGILGFYKTLDEAQDAANVIIDKE